VGCPRSAASGRGAGPRTGLDGVGKVRHLRAIPRGASVPRQRQQRSRPARLRISVREPAAAAAIEARGAHLRRVDLGDAHQEVGSEAEGVLLLRLLDRLHALCARAGSALRAAAANWRMSRCGAGAGAGAGGRGQAAPAAPRLTGDVKLLDHLLVHAHVVRDLPQPGDGRLSGAAEEVGRVEHGCCRRAGGRAGAGSAAVSQAAVRGWRAGTQHARRAAAHRLGASGTGRGIDLDLRKELSAGLSAQTARGGEKGRYLLPTVEFVVQSDRSSTRRWALSVSLCRPALRAALKELRRQNGSILTADWALLSARGASFAPRTLPVSSRLERYGTGAKGKTSLPVCDMVCQHRHAPAHARARARAARAGAARVYARFPRCSVPTARPFRATVEPLGPYPHRNAVRDGSRLARLGWTPAPCAPSPWRGHRCSTTARLPRAARPPRPRRPRPPGTQLPRCGAAHPSAAQRADGRAVRAARRRRRRRRRGRCRRRLGRRRTRSTQAAESPPPASAAGSAGKAARPGALRTLRILPGPARALNVQLRSHRGVDPLTPFPALRKARRCSGSLPRAVPPAARPSPLPSVRLSPRAARRARASACRVGARVGVLPV